LISISKCCHTDRAACADTEDLVQLSLDLEDEQLQSEILILQRQREGVMLLADLARALGEYKAELDLAQFQRSLTEGL